jgi:hypothetical protein
VATAIESLYRDLEYARSLIKRPAQGSDDDEPDAEHGTIRYGGSQSAERSGYSSSGSARGAPSEDWSVISEQDERRNSFSEGKAGLERDRSTKRNSLAAAVLSVLPDAFAPGSPRRRTLSTGGSP